MLEPYYDSYVAMIQMAGGVRRPVTLRAPDFRLDLDALRAAVTPTHPAAAAQLPAQPDRHRPRPATSCRRSPTSRSSTTWSSSPTRSTSTSPSTAPSTSRWRRCPGCASARSPCPAPASRTRSPAGRSAGPPGRRDLVGAVLAAKQWLTFTSGAPLQPAVAHALDDEPDFPRDARARPAGAPRPALRRARASSGSTSFVPQGTYFATTDIVPTSAGRTGVASASRCPSGPGSSRSRRRSSTTTPTPAGHLVRWAFCKTRRGRSRRRGPAGRGRPHRLDADRRQAGPGPRTRPATPAGSSNAAVAAHAASGTSSTMSAADDAEQAEHAGQPGRDGERGRRPADLAARDSASASSRADHGTTSAHSDVGAAVSSASVSPGVEAGSRGAGRRAGRRATSTTTSSEAQHPTTPRPRQPRQHAGPRPDGSQQRRTT